MIEHVNGTLALISVVFSVFGDIDCVIIIMFCSLSPSHQARAVVVQRVKVGLCICMLPTSMAAMESLVHRSEYSCCTLL